MIAICEDNITPHVQTLLSQPFIQLVLDENFDTVVANHAYTYKQP
jgi:hypothetical protein